MPKFAIGLLVHSVPILAGVSNRHRDQAVETDIDQQDKQFAGAVEVSEVNAPDIKAENSFDSTTVKTVQRSVRAEKNSLKYSFPAHSYTLLKAKLT